LSLWQFDGIPNVTSPNHSQSKNPRVMLMVQGIIEEAASSPCKGRLKVPMLLILIQAIVSLAI
jgi:hypothetical protein